METIESLREEFASWLSNETWNWTHYATLTFERPMRKDALRFARAWVRFIARTAPEVWGFCFQETHSDGQRLHVHSLLSVRQDLSGQPSTRDMWSWWFQKFGRCQVVTVRRPSKRELLSTPTASPKQSTSSKAKNHQKICKTYITPLAAYLTKYMVKEAFSDTFDWDFYAYREGSELTPDEFGRYLGVDPTFLA